MKGKGTNMLRFGMNVQNTTCGVSCDALRHTFSDVSYYPSLLSRSSIIFHAESQKSEPLGIAVPRGSFLSFNAKYIITENLKLYNKI